MTFTYEIIFLILLIFASGCSKQSDDVNVSAKKEQQMQAEVKQEELYEEPDIRDGNRDGVFETVGKGKTFYEAVVKLPGIFAASHTGGTSIYKDGVLQTKKPVFDGTGLYYYPDISPDGKYMLGTASRYGYIYIYSTLDGALVKKIKAPKFAVNPKWHPDGKRIIYVGGDLAEGKDNTQSYWDDDGKCRVSRYIYIYIYDMEQDTHTLLYTLTTPIARKSWYMSRKGRKEIYSYFKIFSLRISPDGKKILFAQEALDKKFNKERKKVETVLHDLHGLWVINMDGTDLHKVLLMHHLTGYDWYPDSVHIVKDIAWHYPDGKPVLPEDANCFYKVNLETGEYEKLFYGGGIGSWIRLSYDGKYIYTLRLGLDHPIIVPIDGPNMGKQYIPFEFQQIKNHEGKMVFKGWLYPAWWYDKPFDVEDYVVRRGRKLTKREAESAKKIRNVKIDL